MQKTTAKAAGGTAVGRKASASSGNAPKSFKRSDNKDVLYGRDFEEEAMEIKDIIGEKW